MPLNNSKRIAVVDYYETKTAACVAVFVEKQRFEPADHASYRPCMQ
jgi:hypothetical protein